MTVNETSPDTTAAFEALADLVRDWRERGKRTTTAGVKPALIRATDGAFNESHLGFGSFRAFVVAAQEAGYVALHRPERGHWLLLLPGEDPGTPDLPATSVGSDEVRRLKAPVWSVFVEWGDDWVRLWDKKEGRAFWYPTSEDGRPAWESDKDRFAAIEHASEAVQLGWMREWAETLTPSIRERILPTIGSEGAPGEFRARLVEHQLVGTWRDELRRRMFTFACEWADNNGVSRAALLDRRKSIPNERSRPSAPPPPSAVPAAPVSAPHSTDPGDDLHSEIRKRLHAAVDRMTLAELLDIQVPAHSMLESR
jgi:hypothetical protein